MNDDLVGYSRAGDEFHYRWAARRCLRLLYPKTPLQSIVIEGSLEPNVTEANKRETGEYVIDLAEYSSKVGSNSTVISYYQLKHTTLREDTPFTLSDLRNTIEGFATRYRKVFLEEETSDTPPIIKFSIVTNRRISDAVKSRFIVIAGGGRVLRKDGKDHQFQSTIEEYTQLKGEDLQAFCNSIEFADSEGDYNVQRDELRIELSLILAGAIDDSKIATIVELVRSKVMPDSDGRIVREDVLKRFGVTSQGELFPAPPEYEGLQNVIMREQHSTLLNRILSESTPIIIHAGGGVGKSIVARQLAESLPNGSMGVVYDCFGGGKYRNRSEPRHRHRDALVQIANELASHGLCAPLIAESALEDQIMRQFLTRVNTAVLTLRNANEDAILVILIDAADNAEMAAEEFSQASFAHELLREQMPDGCRLVELCRTERIDLLHPPSSVIQLLLEPFSKVETFNNLRQYISTATEDDALEFHRLTGGNPRVQANALNSGENDIARLLSGLGPLGTTVEDQIEAQLNSAIALVKDQLPATFQITIDSICRGLATLPPLIPLAVLAAAAAVDEDTVKSFVSDLGRPLWLSDMSVQFRDEPTETWFRNNFSATEEQVATYVTRIESLSHTFSYVAESLPSLLLHAGKYEELVDLALSDELLPDNPIDERNVRVYRLQLAFRAALRLSRMYDAIRLALRAGEETAGNKRQLEILSRNVDLIAPLQSAQKVQELAFRRLLRSEWEGSENVYSSALLSSVDDFKGEARGYLRAANSWLRLYFEEREKLKEKHHQEKLRVEDLVELAFAYHNLFGIVEATDFLCRWRPPEFVYRLASRFIRRLVDAGDFDAVDRMSQIGSRNQYLMLAVTRELSETGKFPDADSLRECLILFTNKRTRIAKPRYAFDDTMTEAIVSFAEACAENKLAGVQILRMLRHYFPRRASRSVSSKVQGADRNTYLRAVALEALLSGNPAIDLDDLLPSDWFENRKGHQYEQEIREFKEIVGGMLPWYLLRARLLVDGVDDVLKAVSSARQSSNKVREYGWRDSDRFLYEVSQIHSEILALCHTLDSAQVKLLITDYLKENGRIRIQDRIKVVRTAYRSNHLIEIRKDLEYLAREVISSTTADEPETKADWYIQLARAVLPINPDDAAAYFDCAIEAVSRFGDEVVHRWESVVTLANRSADGGYVSSEMTYRFVRCAELIGEHADFDRDSAMQACARLSPVSAFAALSRWRDRDVGSFSQQLSTLAFEAVNSKFLSPRVGWSLSAFLDGPLVSDIAEACISCEPSVAQQQVILDMAIRDLRLGEATESIWKKLNEVAHSHNIENNELVQILRTCSEKLEPEREEGAPSNVLVNTHAIGDNIDWTVIFDGLELSSSHGISRAIDRFKNSSTGYYVLNAFWQEVFDRIDEKDVVCFLKSLVDAEEIDRYDVSRAVSTMPDAWRNKASVRRYWDEFLRAVARRYAPALTNHYTRLDFIQSLSVPKDKVSIIHEGILAGLSNFDDLADARVFFGFIEVGADYVTPNEAQELLDYALNRFELHIEAEYSDGTWADWLEPPDSTSATFAGFVWSALGSPRSETRWRAAHCVRRLAAMNCIAEIDALMECMEHDEVGPFGSHRFHFYNLHARQYLLIALARVSLDRPDMLQKYHQVLAYNALECMDHVLIQKFASEAALNIEAAFPGTYGDYLIEQFRNIGVSQFPVRQLERAYDEDLSSPWHERGEVNQALEFLHGWDFDRYWFEPLGRVFGISAKQVEELATQVVVREWEVAYDGSYLADPREYIWRSGYSERETWHDHGSYPRTDNFSFYLSYHSMFVVAARLLQQMPVVQARDWYEDRWTEWLNYHTLTRKDGYWLSDRRDPAPMVERDWLHQNRSEAWRLEITPADFLDGLLDERNGETWLNVYGWWTDGDSDRHESYHVKSALVSSPASISLLNALTTCEANDFRLPTYEEEQMEIDVPPFELKGWIWREDSRMGLDEFDPHAGTMLYPPYHIGQLIVDKLQLTVDANLRDWHSPSTDHPSVICELWGTNKYRQDEDPLRQGRRLSTSLTFLRRLCETFECQMVFDVQVERQYRYGSYMRSQDGNKYAPPYHKVYLFTADGKLRDTETSYRLRQDPCC